MRIRNIAAISILALVLAACVGKEIPSLSAQDLTRIAQPVSVSAQSYAPKVYATGAGENTPVDEPPQHQVVTSTPSLTPYPSLVPTSKPIKAPKQTLTDTATPQPKPTALPPPTRMPTTSPARYVPHVPNPSYGIAVAFTGSADSRLAALTRVQELGFEWVKAQILWSSIEGSRKGEYNWALADAIVNETSARGLKVLVSVIAAPDWARPASDDRSQHGFPANPQDLADFLAALAGRYAGKVQAIEVWNEENLWTEVGGIGRMSVAKYMAALRASNSAIKAVAPNIIVVSGGLTPTGVNDGRIAIDDRQYLRHMYEGGLASVSDAIGAHPSGFNVPPDADITTFNGCRAFTPPCQNHHPSWSFSATLRDYQAIKEQYGDGAKQIWATEFGWAALIGGKQIRAYEYGADNSPWQAGEYLRTAYTMAKGWPWLGVMFTWNLNYAEVDGVSNERAAFSILDENGNQRDQFAALQGMNKQ